MYSDNRIYPLVRTCHKNTLYFHRTLILDFLFSSFLSCMPLNIWKLCKKRSFQGAFLKSFKCCSKKSWAELWLLQGFTSEWKQNKSWSQADTPADQAKACVWSDSINFLQVTWWIVEDQWMGFKRTNHVKAGWVFDREISFEELISHCCY